MSAKINWSRQKVPSFAKGRWMKDISVQRDKYFQLGTNRQARRKDVFSPLVLKLMEEESALIAARKNNG